MDKLIIGTRGSKLAIAQTEKVRQKLSSISPQTVIEIKIITTTGDTNMTPVPLDTVGKGWFTKEIDKALLDGSIDLAVHSLKDLPEELPNGLVIAAILEREDAREALISRGNIPFEKLKEGSVIGTDSTRRKSQILYKRPDLVVKSIRGNVNTRLKKLDEGEYDGIFLAVAGLKRLNLENRITQYFSETDFIPSPGQGALAVTIKKNNKRLIKILQKINHEETNLQTRAERAFSLSLGGGCKMPVGAYACVKKDKIMLHVFVGLLDGKKIFMDSLQGNLELPEELGTTVAKKFLNKGFPWFEKPKYVIFTRAQNMSMKVQKEIQNLGLQTFFYPSITITKSKLTKVMQNIFLEIDSFDWFIFTSQYGVRIFKETIDELEIPLTRIKNKKIAVVGEKTAEAVTNYGLKVNFIPSKFTTETLAKEIKNIAGKKILMLRGDLSTPILIEELQKKGATIIDIPIYKTSFKENNNLEFENFLLNQQVYCITFTSPSTVTGFLKNIKDLDFKEVIFSLPAFSIGPVTTRELKKQGFKNIYTADIYTIDGVIAKIKENIL